MSEFGGMFAAAARYFLIAVFVTGFFLGLMLWVLYEFTGPWDSCLRVFGIGGCF